MPCFLEAFESASFKWLDCWATFPGVICALASESILATALAKWMLDGDIHAAVQTCNSEIHDSKISLSGCVEFITERIDRDKLLQLQWVVDCKPGLRLLADRCPLWENDQQAMVQLCEFAQHRVLPVLSSTHKTEFFA
jgi:hypothetical protein